LLKAMICGVVHCRLLSMEYVSGGNEQQFKVVIAEATSSTALSFSWSARNVLEWPIVKGGECGVRFSSK